MFYDCLLHLQDVHCILVRDVQSLKLLYTSNFIISIITYIHAALTIDFYCITDMHFSTHYLPKTEC